MIPPYFTYDQSNVLNFCTAHALIALFDVCYKNGVVHAFQLGDENEAKNFVEDCRLPGRYQTLCDTDIFGRLSDGRAYNLNEWRITLSHWARATQRRRSIEWYIENAKSERTYTGVAYQLCMDFYLQGIYNYASYPINDLEVFLHTRYMVLSPAEGRFTPNHIRNADEWTRDVQRLCIERADLERLRDEGEQHINKSTYDNFARVFWHCVYGRRAAIRENNKRTKNERKRKAKDL